MKAAQQKQNLKPEDKSQAAIEIIMQASEGWPGIISRAKAVELAGGAVASGTLANDDCKGVGPTGSFKIGRNRVYPRQGSRDYLIRKIEV